MRYIRFLKTPKVLKETGSKSTIKAVITITSDLGESFFQESVYLAASLRSHDHNGDIYLRKAFKWESGMRALPITFEFEEHDIDWPARVHVTVRNSPMSDHFETHANGADLPSIISAWSDVLDPYKGLVEAAKAVERRFTPLSNRTLSIWEETGESIARHLWYVVCNVRVVLETQLMAVRDAGIALSAYLDRMVALQAEGIPLVEQAISSATFKRLNIIELGSGCGIVGITLAQTVPDCDVLLTDLPEAAEIARRNIDAMNPAMASLATFEALAWEDPLPESVHAKSFDIVVVADCTYNSDSSPALVRTLTALTKRSPKAIILLAMKVRHSSEAVFFDLMKEAHLVEASQMKIPLPETEEETEEIEVYVFHSEDRPSYADRGSLESAKPMVHFWPE